MGGMFSVVKIRDGLARDDYKDPGPYKHPQGTVAYEIETPQSEAPRQVATVLNDFFRIVVNAVDEREGMINKFEGDAALAVFGAPLRTRLAPLDHHVPLPSRV